jgi:hypothetical protein
MRPDPIFRSHSARRKETGTFYTPQPLAEFVVRRTLAPLVEHAPADAILALRVVDPAMGSGAFLVAACRYLAAAYERALVDEGRAGTADIDEGDRAGFRRLVAERCLAGVDANPVAVQLARLSLWLATLAEGRPLSFLDHRLRAGNSLIGASPDDLVRLSGARTMRNVPLPLFDHAGLEHSIRDVVRPLTDLATRPDDTVADVRAKEAVWERLASDRSPLAPWRLAADVWCARWCEPARSARASPSETAAVIAAILRHDRTLPAPHVATRTAEALAARGDHSFFHWPLEFSDVFYDDDGAPRARPGFDAVIGNPPWEMLRHDARESAGDDGRSPDAFAAFIRESGVYRASNRGHLNLYQPFLERALSVCRAGGRVGLILPWGLSVDDGSTELRRMLIESSGLDTIVGLDNAEGLFPIHRGVRFAVIVASPGRPAGEVRARFGVKTAAELDALPDRDGADESAYPVRLGKELLQRVGGPTLRIPDVRRPEFLRLLEAWIGMFPPLGAADGWSARFGRELNASDDRASFGETGLPVLEGKHLEPFRAYPSLALSHLPPETAQGLLPDGRYRRPRVGYRDVSSVSNTRSLVAAVLPADVVTTHTIFCLRTPAPLDAMHFLCGVMNSFVLNVVVRLLMGGHVTTSLVEQLPVPKWTGVRAERRIARLARALAAGRQSDRVLARLEAEVAALYRVSAADLQVVVDSFPLVSRTVRNLAVELRKVRGA